MTSQWELRLDVLAGDRVGTVASKSPEGLSVLSWTYRIQENSHANGLVTSKGAVTSDWNRLGRPEKSRLLRDYSLLAWHQVQTITSPMIIS